MIDNPTYLVVLGQELQKARRARGWTRKELAAVSSRDEGRDSQGRYVTVSYVVLLPAPVPVLVGDAVRDVRWRRVIDVLAEDMPWDHREIILEALRVAGLALDVG